MAVGTMQSTGNIGQAMWWIVLLGGQGWSSRRSGLELLEIWAGVRQKTRWAKGRQRAEQKEVHNPGRIAAPRR